MPNNNEILMNMVGKMQPIEFAGLAKLLGISLVKEVNPEAEDIKDKYAAKDFLEVLEEVMKKFNGLSRQRKREILKLVKKSNSTR